MASSRLEIMSSTNPVVQPVENSVAVRDFPAEMAERWDSFVLSQPDGTMCHLTAWKRAIEATFGFKACYCYCERAGKITGVLPLFSISNWIIGNCLHSVPFGVYGGICAADEESRDALVEHAKRLASSTQVDHLELHQRNGRLLPDFHLNHLYVTFKTALAANPETNLKKLPRDTRYMIRKGEKAGLSVKHGLEQLPLFYKLFCESVHRLGTPVFPSALFENLVREFGSQIDLMVVYAGVKPISGVFSFHHRDTVFPYYAGATSEASVLAANNFMYWQLMKHAAEAGFTSFDFGRSKRDTGAYHFKSQWGMIPEELNYQVYLVRRKSVPNFSPVNPKFEMAARAWRRLPLGLANYIGPSIVRWFP